MTKVEQVSSTTDLELGLNKLPVRVMQPIIEVLIRDSRPCRCPLNNRVPPLGHHICAATVKVSITRTQGWRGETYAGQLVTPAAVIWLYTKST
jgi:hypothetical protein